MLIMESTWEYSYPVQRKDVHLHRVSEIGTKILNKTYVVLFGIDRGVSVLLSALGWSKNGKNLLKLQTICSSISENDKAIPGLSLVLSARAELMLFLDHPGAFIKK